MVYRFAAAFTDGLLHKQQQAFIFEGEGKEPQQELIVSRSLTFIAAVVKEK